MASLLRRLQRKKARDNKTYVGPEQPFKVHEDGGYSVLRPTKGWLKVSGKRVRLGLAARR